MEIRRTVELVSICLAGCNGMCIELVRGGGEDEQGIFWTRHGFRLIVAKNFGKIGKLKIVVRKKLCLQFELTMRYTQDPGTVFK
jgi:hypothetical protein